jgi:hypothetical protein
MISTKRQRPVRTRLIEVEMRFGFAVADAVGTNENRRTPFGIGHPPLLGMRRDEMATSDCGAVYATAEVNVVCSVHGI